MKWQSVSRGRSRRLLSSVTCAAIGEHSQWRRGRESDDAGRVAADIFSSIIREYWAGECLPCTVITATADGYFNRSKRSAPLDHPDL